MNWNPFRFLSLKNKAFLGVLVGVVLTSAAVYFAYGGMKRTSTNEYCASCHVHPQATTSWKQGVHYRNPSGVVTKCIDCHLPPEGFDHLWEKSKAGIRDLYSFYFRDTAAIDWEARSVLDNAVHFTFDSACSSCHVELFPIEIAEKGVDAHLHYRKNLDELRCVNCHLKTGHFHDEPEEEFVLLDEAEEEAIEMAPLLAEIPEGAFEDYTDVVPGTKLKFELVAVEGGTFLMGSPESEVGREADEGPQREVRLNPFWMGKFEISWREFDVYYSQTVTREKNEQGEMSDAMTGPTPPYGSPDQGWGKGLRPAITMTHYAAQKYCQWLSLVTGRQYRLPTEAEWEYAARGGSQGSFFFEEEVLSESWFDGFKRRFLGGSSVDEEVLGRFAWYRGNSKLRSYPSRTKEDNPFGLQNMLGNVKEYCADWYDPQAYGAYTDGVVENPTGPDSGEEHVVRGGSYRSEATELRVANREATRHDAWLKTDPQNPKSVWWYSDNAEVGFRIVREYEGQ